ncbi:MAG TPA: nucleotide sugar dehydrogenase [Nitrosomonas nitrosa]|jgi:UDP-N-acetyl-D-galactosamine dehydrogenase|uniref:Protein CapL n=1 Tax=Nitrosomonas nitrosa TaxID=52442 RepID=A0A1I4MZJ0_9PROT|nr:nucleotide sugar dehydrogenase [Nitrosomonas nitrosa]MCO6433861.1 nucleotide sugar dehydrogenase [Nitrosomonas nitrosa]PTQ96167.1 UDP-N-acetyl-D-galactosamine dehydrogenase [Nitrosomonas nitrosa]CAE6490022.1 Protein CapL [Nitrosomonas nitrosa]SFM08691.1 UDP-N-acetyl-D-galactosamine dehydrogenase [Nitrosomonas nitrosa]HBZ30454.1 nucleotide sugar dehydrogenase [Nitrosomonas nitrosa]
MSIVAVVGLGYVGLPLAVEFGKKQQTIGFDLSTSKIESYKRHIDPTGEVPSAAFQEASQLMVTSDPAALSQADYIIVAVPTPVDAAHQPNFAALASASEIVGKHMKHGVTVIYESTVYPGATEEVCIPVLAKCSSAQWKKDFFVGYSPERINPGDKQHTLTTITKIVSGDTPETLEKIARLYESVVTAGVYRASSIKVAEAAKVIENTQRDLNIALMNELAIIFDKLGIDTLEILQAAGTKWNFLPFRPGLVGGHCIGVDPYYLTHKAEMMGYMPQVILAGRRINDNMAKFVAEQTIKQIIKAGFNVKGAKVNVLGLTFKENCPDLRNSKVVDVISELCDYGVEVFVHDPVADVEDARHEYGIELQPWDQLPQAHAMIVAVSHQELIQKPLGELQSKIVEQGCFIDVKSQFDEQLLRKAGLSVWRL